MAAAGLPVRLVEAAPHDVGDRVPAPHGAALGPERARPGDRPGRRRRPGPDARLDGRGGAGAHARDRATSTSTRGRATGCGGRARRAATSSASATSPSTATPTRSCVRSTRSARRAIANTRSCFDPDGAPADADDPGLRLARDALGDDRLTRRERPDGSYTTAPARRRRRRGRPQGDRGGDRGPDRRQGRRGGRSSRGTDRDATRARARRRDRRPPLPRARRCSPSATSRPAGSIDVLRARHAG